jgi:hypothetical protein
MGSVSLLSRERVMAETSTDFITVREAYNIFAQREDLAGMTKVLDEHRSDDREAFEKLDTKLDHTTKRIEEVRDEVRAGRLPKWAFWVLGTLATIGVPFLVVMLEHYWK